MPQELNELLDELESHLEDLTCYVDEQDFRGARSMAQSVLQSIDEIEKAWNS